MPTWQEPRKVFWKVKLAANQLTALLIALKRGITRTMDFLRQILPYFRLTSSTSTQWHFLSPIYLNYAIPKTGSFSCLVLKGQPRAINNHSLSLGKPSSFSQITVHLHQNSSKYCFGANIRLPMQRLPITVAPSSKALCVYVLGPNCMWTLSPSFLEMLVNSLQLLQTMLF